MKKIYVILAFLCLTFALGNRVQAQCDNGTDCYIALEGHDSYGDGWNGNEITFVQNGVAIGTFTLDNGSTGYDTIRVCTGNGVITCNWASGLYATEVSFTITDSLGSVLYNCVNGSTLSDGSFATLAPCPSCPSPSSFAVSDVTSDGVTVSWTEPGSATSWYYCYGTGATPSGVWTNASTNSVSLTGLQTNTRYYFFVYSDCGMGDTSAVSSFDFRTACGEISLPYTETFESYDADEQMPFCWTRWDAPSEIDWMGDLTHFPNIVDYESHSGSHSFYFYPNYGTQSVISPRIPAPANTLEVQMWIIGGEVVQVGYVTTNDTATAVFHPVATVGPSDDTIIDEWGWQYSMYKWTRVTVPFDNLTITDSIYVVLRAEESIEYEALNIDDLVIRQINSCPQPENVRMTGTTSDEMSLAWSCTGGSQWQVAYGPSGFNPDTATALVESNSMAATLTNLDNQTMYDIYVRTVCGAQYSYWSSVFSAMPNVHVVNASFDTVTSCGVTIVDDGGIDGQFSLNLNQIIVLQPDTEGQTIHIDGFAHLYNSYGSYQEDMNILRVFAGSDTNGVLLGNYNTVNVDNINLTSDVGAMTLWFRSGSYSGDENDGFRLAVSCVDMPSCTTPYGLTMSNVSGSYAMASWEYNTVNGEAPGFTLSLFDNAGTMVESYAVDGTERSYVFTDLSERTTYWLVLSVDCPGTDSVEVRFTTDCNNGGEVAIGSGTATSSFLPAYLYGASSISQQLFTAAELIDVSSISGFKVYMTSSGNTPSRQWDVFLDTTSMTSYSGVDDYVVPTMENRYFSGSVTFSQGWVTVNFDSTYTVPAGKSVVLTVNDKSGVSGSSRSFRTTTTSDVMSLCGYIYNGGTLDATNGNDFFNSLAEGYTRRNTIRLLSDCNESGCQPPIIVSVEPDVHSVTLTWTAVGSETAWKVEYRTVSDNWTTAVASTNSTTYTVTGLDAITTYSFRVSTLCGTEEAARTTTATTLCGEEALPFSENFELFRASSYEDEMQHCWYRGSNYMYDYYYYPSLDSYNARQSSFSMAMGGYRSYLVLPKMEARVDSLSVSFYAVNTYLDESGVLEVGVCTNPNDTTTFTVVATHPVNDTAWLLMETDLENYNGPDGRIFIRIQQEQYCSVNIDDIVVDRLPDCRRVNSVTVSNIGLSSATLTLTDNHNYGNYILFYGTDNDTATATTMAFSGTTVTVTGLAENTKYYMWVAASCAPGSIGRTFAVPAFRTLCSAIAVTEESPYLEEFEVGELECMLMESASGLKWMVNNGNESVHSHSGSFMVSVASPSNQSSMLVLPTFDFTALDEDAEFSFYRFQSQYNEYGYTSGPAGLLEVFYRTSPTATWTLLATIDSSVNTWDRFFYTLPSSQGAATYQLAMKGSPMGNTNGIFVDDLLVSAAPNCRIPQNVTVRNIDDRSATVAWTGNASTYRVQFRAVGALSWITRTVEYADSLNITPLDMASRYEVRVTSVCSPSEWSEASNVVFFSTDFCNNRLDVVNYASGDVATVSTVAPVNTAKGYSYAEVLFDAALLTGMTEVNGMAFYIDNVGSASYMTDCQVYMGHTSVTSMSQFQYDTSFVMVYDGDISATTTGLRRVRFSTPFVWDGSSNVVMGVMYSTPDYDMHETTQFAAHQGTVNKLYYGGSQYTDFSPDQANTLSAANRGASNVVPDITLYGCLPTCYEPVLNAVTTTASSISVEWYDENAIVHIQMKETSSSEWNDMITVNLSHNGEHSYTFTMLPDKTSYNIRLRRDCASEEMGFSDWVELIASTDTMCSVPYDVNVSNIGATSATIGWTDGAITGGRWEIHVWNNDEDHYYDVTANPASVNGLTAGSTYQVAVRAYCCADNRVVGEYSNSVTFNNVCQPVTGLNASRNGNDVTLTWQAGEYNTGWVYSYGYEGFEPNQQLGYGLVQEPTVTITGLADGVTYTFRVRARCGEDWNSVWSADVNCAIVGIDEVEADNARIALMPNPASDRVLLRLSAFNGTARVSIFGVDGRTVSELGATEPDLSVDVSALAAGTYFVRVQTNDWIAVRKLVIR